MLTAAGPKVESSCSDSVASLSLISVCRGTWLSLRFKARACGRSTSLAHSCSATAQTSMTSLTRNYSLGLTACIASTNTCSSSGVSQPRSLWDKLCSPTSKRTSFPVSPYREELSRSEESPRNGMADPSLTTAGRWASRKLRMRTSPVRYARIHVCPFTSVAVQRASSTCGNSIKRQIDVWTSGCSSLTRPWKTQIPRSKPWRR